MLDAGIIHSNREKVLSSIKYPASDIAYNEALDAAFGEVGEKFSEPF